MGTQADRDVISAIAGQAYEELQAWCQAHPGYTLMELEQQAMFLRQHLMGEVMSKLVAQKEAVQPVDGVTCPRCQGTMEDKGRRRRLVRGPEGSVALDRVYSYCPSCKEGFFPSGPRVAADASPLD